MHTLRLVEVVRELSAASSLERVMEIVRHAGRELTYADGATFILRDGDYVYYADEDAIAPLWKGQRFPMSTCISGWSMAHRTPVAIPDVYKDTRIPHDLYRPTFIKSMAMVPMRGSDQIGAIGTYWASPHEATMEEMEILIALADLARIALENLNLVEKLRESKQEAENRAVEVRRLYDNAQAELQHRLVLDRRTGNVP